MFKLSDFRSKAIGLPDLLTYAVLIEPGIILQKDGSFLATFEVKGQDTASSTAEDLALVSEQFSNAAKRLGDGWILHIDACRSTQKAYPDANKSVFPDPISLKLDNARRDFFNKNNTCYNTNTYLSCTYLPNYKEAKLSSLAKSGVESQDAIDKSLDLFRSTLRDIEDSLKHFMSIIRLREYEIVPHDGNGFLNSDLLSFLQCCITGELQPMRVPNTPMYLDALLGGRDLVGGMEPYFQEGGEKKYLSIISIDGLPQESWPSMLSIFDGVPFEYRFNTRYICMSQDTAVKEINMYSKGWNQKVYRFIDQFFNNPNAKANRDALIMREDAEVAKTEVQGGHVGAGYLTSTIILMDTDKNLLENKARELRRAIQTLGFVARVEDINILEAWQGSLPGNGYHNIRRPIINTLNLADMLPLQSVWTGNAVAPCPFYPAESPPLAVFLTENGTTPFWFNIHVGDLGHTLIFGPTGSGKSTLLATIAWNFRRYGNSCVFAFDKGNSLYPLCKGVGGEHFNIGIGDALAFAPLQRISDSVDEMSWAEQWILNLLTLQDEKITPTLTNAVHDAMQLLAEQPEGMRTLTHFSNIVASQEIREALLYYTMNGPMGRLLDAESDNLNMSNFMVFEIETLMESGEKNMIPVLLYLFRRIEKAMQGNPMMIILDEAWIMLKNAVFRDKIKEWLKVLRKLNCAVVLATQSLSDAKSSGLMDVLSESCPTKIFLANPQARQQEHYDIYRGIGLNDRQIDILSTAIPKRDYYMTNNYGRRLFQLGLSPLELAFVGSSDKVSLKRIYDLEKEFGENNWQEHWIKEKVGLSY